MIVMVDGHAERPYRAGLIRLYFLVWMVIAIPIVLFLAVFALGLGLDGSANAAPVGIGVAVLAGGVVLSWRAWRVGIATGPGGLTVRSLTWSRDYRWSEVERVSVKNRRSLLGQQVPTVCVETSDGGTHFHPHLFRRSPLVLGGDHPTRIAEAVSRTRP